MIAVCEEDELRAFNAFPRAIYHDMFHAPSFPCFDPVGGQFNNPLFQRVSARPFLAVKDGSPAGRIAASINHAYPAEGTGFFGYFESLNDLEVTAALLQAASRWLSGNGMRRVTGPVDLTPHERLGLLAEGFEGPHLPGMPYNPSYYTYLLTRAGLRKEISLYAYYYNLRRPLPEKLVRVARRATVWNKQLSLREVNFHDLANEGKMLAHIHNYSMSDGWGFVPLSATEGAAIWQKLSGFCDPGLILVAEINGSPAGLCLAIHPAGSPVFAALSMRPVLRLAVLAVLPQYRLKGLEAVLIHECVQRARRKGITLMELSQVAENNRMMNQIIQRLGHEHFQRSYDIYQANIIDINYLQ